MIMKEAYVYIIGLCGIVASNIIGALIVSALFGWKFSTVLIVLLILTVPMVLVFYLIGKNNTN